MGGAWCLHLYDHGEYFTFLSCVDVVGVFLSKKYFLIYLAVGLLKNFL